MTVTLVLKYLNRRMNWKFISEFILEKSHMNVNHVKRLLHISDHWNLMKEFTQVKEIVYNLWIHKESIFFSTYIISNAFNYLLHYRKNVGSWKIWGKLRIPIQISHQVGNGMDQKVSWITKKLSFMNWHLILKQKWSWMMYCWKNYSH